MLYHSYMCSFMHARLYNYFCEYKVASIIEINFICSIYHVWISTLQNATALLYKYYSYYK